MCVCSKCNKEREVINAKKKDNVLLECAKWHEEQCIADQEDAEYHGLNTELGEEATLKASMHNRFATALRKELN